MIVGFDPQVCCDSCGAWTGSDTGCCGQCAEDYNDRDSAAGIRRINRRRADAGLAPVDRGVTYPRCGACGYGGVDPTERACPRCGEDAIVRDRAEHGRYSDMRMRDEGKL